MSVSSPPQLAYFLLSSCIEYRQVNPNPVDFAGDDMKWTDTEAPGQYGLRFASTLKIKESDEVFASGNYGFSSQPATFTTKKAGRKYAAMLAVKWLIQHNYMPDNGAVRYPKVITLPPAPRVRDPNEIPYATQVPEICTRLGFGVPRYNVTEVIAGTALYNVYADFGPDPRIEGKVGEVKDVYGKKNAKEQSAKLVVQFMKDIERQRSATREVEFEDETEEAAVAPVDVTAEDDKKAEEDEVDLNADDEKKRKRSSVGVEASKKTAKV